MTANDLIFLRRKEIIGLIAVAAWGLGLLSANTTGTFGDIAAITAVVTMPIGWFFTIYWLALDASYRGMRTFWWTLFAIAALPLALLFHFLYRPPMPVLCYQCGAQLASAREACPTCGRQSFLGAAKAVSDRLRAGLADTPTSRPTEQAKRTAKHTAITLAGVAALGLIAGSMPDAIRSLYDPSGPAPWWADLLVFAWMLSIPAYWVTVAWWVYLDAMWRRMDAAPWALLALLTNIFGLATYLVIRYPDPHLCPACRAYLATELARCPYCGAETEPTCPRCQAPVRADWVYCPACAAQLPARPASGGDSAASPPQDEVKPSVSVGGAVIDALSGSPIQGAEVKIDSKTAAGTATTDPLGRFMLADLEPRPYVFLASADGYIAEAKAYTPGAGGLAQLHFSLHPAEPPPA